MADPLSSTIIRDSVSSAGKNVVHCIIPASLRTDEYSNIVQRLSQVTHTQDVTAVVINMGGAAGLKILDKQLIHSLQLLYRDGLCKFLLDLIAKCGKAADTKAVIIDGGLANSGVASLVGDALSSLSPQHSPSSTSSSTKDSEDLSSPLSTTPAAPFGSNHNNNNNNNNSADADSENGTEPSTENGNGGSRRKTSPKQSVKSATSTPLTTSTTTAASSTATTAAAATSTTSKIMTVGVAPFHRVSVPYPDLQKLQKQPNARKTSLEPNHALFVLPNCSTWGGETESMFHLAQAFASNGMDDSPEYSMPSIGILANGGRQCRTESLHCVRSRIPIVVIEGSGYLADDIAARWRQSHDADDDDDDDSTIATTTTTTASKSKSKSVGGGAPSAHNDGDNDDSSSDSSPTTTPSSTHRSSARTSGAPAPSSRQRRGSEEKGRTTHPMNHETDAIGRPDYREDANNEAELDEIIDSNLVHLFPIEGTPESLSELLHKIYDELQFA